MAGKTGGSNKALIPILVGVAVLAVGFGAWALVSGGGSSEVEPVARTSKPKKEKAKPRAKTEDNKEKTTRSRKRTRDTGDAGRERTPTREVAGGDNTDDERQKPKKKKKKKKKKVERDWSQPPSRL
jgi:hypothetical protein